MQHRIWPGRSDLRRALERARRKVADIERRVQPADPAAPRNLTPLREVPQVIRGLVQDLERQGRQGVRRTVHAEERGTQQRPVHMAIEDLHRAGPDQFFFDEHRRTIVVLGSRHRAHAFTPGRPACDQFLAGSGGGRIDGSAADDGASRPRKSAAVS
ncbi:MAG: hypothetical protein ACOX52_17010 [Verrucomicrobiota bacterium]